MKWLSWKDVSVVDRVELLRSQMTVERSVVNVLFWFAITLVIGLGDWPVFAFVPAMATALSGWGLSKSWKANSQTIREIREGKK